MTTEFLYDGWNPVQETEGSTVNPVLTGLGIDEFYARDDSSGRTYLLADVLGSTIALTDASSTVRRRYHYEPYGGVTETGDTGPFSNPYQYTGRENDRTGLYYYRARYYSPVLKRFISEDPIGLAGGLNTYAFVFNDPLGYFDPFGEAGHRKNKTPTNKPRHDRGDTRRSRDAGAEKADPGRRHPSKRQPDYKGGSWPPKPKPSMKVCLPILFINPWVNAALLLTWSKDLGGCEDDFSCPESGDSSVPITKDD